MARLSKQDWRGRTGSRLEAQHRPSLKDRFGAFSALAATGLLIAIGPPALIDYGLRLIWRPEPEPLMWWAAPSGYAIGLMVAGIVLATVLGLIGLAVGRPPRAAWRVLAVAAILWLPAPFLATQAVTRVYDDRIEARGPWSSSVRTLPFAEVQSIHVGCSALDGGRRRTPVPTITYVLRFQHGESIDLTKGVRRRNTQAVRSWLGAVIAVDTVLATQDTPRIRIRDVNGDDGIRPMCLRALSESLGPVDFHRARRLLMVGNADLYRYGLDPRGVW